MSQPNFYAIIPANVRYDEKLVPNAKLLYGEITALCNQEGFCWADNAYFGKLYKVDNKTISRWISSLESCGYLAIEHFQNNGNTRKIYIENTAQNLVIKKSLPSDKIVTSIYENITINNTVNREATALAFFELNYPSEYERLMMQFKKQINDFVKFTQMFDATVEQEKLEFDLSVLSGRFKKYALNWITNQNKFDSPVIELNANVRKEKIGGF